MSIVRIGGLALGLLAGSASMAAASLISQTMTAPATEVDTDSFVGNTPTATGSNGTITFAGFDPTLGTLTAVQLVRNTTETFSGALTNTLGTSETFSYVAASRIGFVNSPAGTLGNQLIGITPYNFTSITIGAGQTDTLPTAGSTPFNSTYTVQSNFIADFENGPLSFGVQTSLLSSVQQGSAFLDGIEQKVSAVNSGTYTLNYTYTPNAAPVPEPASLMVLGVGLVGLGLVRRRGSRG